jgi:hypothetical protein
MPHATKEARNAYSKAYYKEHRVEINARSVLINRRQRQGRYAEIRALKSNPCTDCGGSFSPCVMDFDHRDPATKTDEISVMVKRMVAWGLVLAEIAKCDLVCSCCHRLRTYSGSNCYKTRRFERHKLILDELKSSTPCLDCGGSFKPCQMDFDHSGEHSKVANIARLAGGATETLITELRKCHLVCANCHRVRTSTGLRPKAAAQGDTLVQRFREIEARVGLPDDQRFAPFPSPELLGVVPDKELAERTGISRQLVAWHRRKAGIMLNRQSRRAA